jgi:hypothetical protein
MLEIIPHPEQQRTYFELREEFRRDNQERIHSQLKSHPVGWGVLGDSELARDRYSAGDWAKSLLAHLDAPVVQDFGLRDVPFTESVRIEKLAKESLLHDSVTWEDGTEGVVDHDAPPCEDVTTMTDERLFEYVDRSIEESRRG